MRAVTGCDVGMFHVRMSGLQPPFVAVSAADIPGIAGRFRLARAGRPATIGCLMVRPVVEVLTATNA